MLHSEVHAILPPSLSLSFPFLPYRTVNRGLPPETGGHPHPTSLPRIYTATHLHMYTRQYRPLPYLQQRGFLNNTMQLFCQSH
ncbi:hypothetical protein SK128_020944, partial [Halocaridina rubra]